MTDFGTDLDDTSPGGEVRGTLLAGQRLARRLRTPRGGLLDDPNFGMDLAATLFDDATTSDVARISSDVDAELQKDEVVLSSKSTITLVGKGEDFVATLTTLVESAAGPFRLVMQVKDATATLVEVT